MDRFHIVVSNYERLSCFVDNFQRIQGFDGAHDRVYILDCSPNPGWQEQMAVADRLTSSGLRWGESLHFIRRRNWNMNLGAQLDYIRCLLDDRIPIPTYAAFMQDHYLDLNRFVQEDTIPDGAVYDLDLIESEFRSDPNVGCVFLARYGIRVSASNPMNERGKDFCGDGTELLPRARRRCFCIDGGNFIVRPRLYLDWFKAHPRFLTRGDGAYGFALVWEVRLGKILYDQRIEWVDLYRHLKYSTIEQLDALQESLAQRVSMLWYDNRVYSLFYGGDFQRYPPTPLTPVRLYLRQYLSRTLLHSRDTRLVFVQPGEVER